MIEHELLPRAYGQITEAVEHLSPAGFLRPTGAAAWCVQDLLFHLLLDAQRALVAFATPADPPPDVDRASYWASFRPGTDPDAEAGHARFVRIASAAYRDPATLVQHWHDASAAAVRASARPPEYVSTQGHVLSAPDFVSTLVVEAGIHHLDLTTRLPGAAAPDPAVLAHCRMVLHELAGEAFPTGWNDVDAVRWATGRARPDPVDTAEVVRRFPLLG